MNWVQRKIYLYNVTFGLYMLDRWERYLFNTLVLVLMWFMFHNGSRYITDLVKRIWLNLLTTITPAGMRVMCVGGISIGFTVSQLWKV